MPQWRIWRSVSFWMTVIFRPLIYTVLQWVNIGVLDQNSIYGEGLQLPHMFSPSLATHPAAHQRLSPGDSGPATRKSCYLIRGILNRFTCPNNMDVFLQLDSFIDDWVDRFWCSWRQVAWNSLRYSGSIPLKWVNSIVVTQSQVLLENSNTTNRMKIITPQTRFILLQFTVHSCTICCRTAYFDSFIPDAHQWNFSKVS
jgi:hypothetical protein